MTNQLLRLFQLRGSAQLLAVARIVIGLCSLAVGWEVWRILSRLLNPLVVQLPYFALMPRLPLSCLPVFVGRLVSRLNSFCRWAQDQTSRRHHHVFFGLCVAV